MFKKTAAKKDEEDASNHVLTTERIVEIMEKENLGLQLKKYERLWFKNERGVRRANIAFGMTDDELSEYTKCKLDVHYFAEKYCKVKREDGSVGNIKLRGYQKELINLYTQNARSIAICSRQIGKCLFGTSTVKIAIFDETYSSYTIEEKYIYELYYNEIKKTRKLTILEFIKLILYRLLSKV